MREQGAKDAHDVGAIQIGWRQSKEHSFPFELVREVGVESAYSWVA